MQGDGLSLTTFQHSCGCTNLACECTLKNTGERSGDEVLMVYDSLSGAIRKAVGDAHPVPQKRLLDFERVTLAAGAQTTVKFKLSAEQLQLVTADGSAKSYPGTHEIVFSRGSGNDQTVAVTVPEQPLASAASPSPSPTGSRKFAAISIVGQMGSGVQRVIGQTTKHSANPLFVQDTPQESRIDNGYPNIIPPAGRDKAWQLWYGTCGVGNQAILYANSTDGLAWKKPSLGLVTFGPKGNSTRQNNIVMVK